jgi:UDP-N-acetyl-D-mannosaminuronic acid dehydrogenase
VATVCVVGLGYIGLPTAAVIARSGASVLGIDISPHVVETINAGRIHIEEANLESLVHEMVASGSLRAALAPEPSDVFVIAVPTPFTDNHAPDIKYVLDVPGRHHRGGARRAQGSAPRSQLPRRWRCSDRRLRRLLP